MKELHSRQSTATRRIEKRYGKRADRVPGNPADAGIVHIGDIPTSTPLILLGRVSSSCQDLKQNLNEQMDDCLTEIALRGFRVIDKVREVESGWISDDPDDRQQLRRAVSIAKENSAAIVVQDLDRLIRNSLYHPSENPHAVPSRFELKLLRDILDGVPVCTLIDPSAPRFGPEGIRSNEIKRGQKKKNRKGGRPGKRRAGYKKRQKERNLPLAKNLRATGMPYHSIADHLGIPKSTIADWLK